MNTESLIFDIDGTLWDSRALVAKGYNEEFHRAGLDRLCVNVEDLKKLFGKTITELTDLMLSSVEKSRRYELMERCMATAHEKICADPCRIGYPEVAETLEALSEKHRLFIVSNSQLGYPELTMEKLGIGHLISGHLCFGDTGTDKGTTILTLMKQYHITDAVYIGDTQGDYEATRKAGIPFVWAAYGFGRPEGYEAKIEIFRDLLTLF